MGIEGSETEKAAGSEFLKLVLVVEQVENSGAVQWVHPLGSLGFQAHVMTLPSRVSLAQAPSRRTPPLRSADARQLHTYLGRKLNREVITEFKFSYINNFEGVKLGAPQIQYNHA